MRPPRETLQPIGQQQPTQQPAAVPSAPTSIPLMGRVQTRPLPGVVVLPAQIAERMS